MKSFESRLSASLLNRQGVEATVHCCRFRWRAIFF